MGKTIVDKLKLLSYQKKAVINRPNDQYLPELTDVVMTFPSGPVDLLVVFVKDMKEFKKTVDKVIEKQLLNEQGVLVVAYPKKGNKMYSTFVHRDEIFPNLQVDESDGYIKKSTLKFNRMVKLDEVFTVVGIKNFPRKEGIKTKQSERIDDYVQFIPDVEAFLKVHEKARRLYNQLTSGYKKEWARYIYSGKQAATQNKRKAEMVEILEKGFKSKELYRQSLRN